MSNFEYSPLEAFPHGCYWGDENRGQRERKAKIGLYSPVGLGNRMCVCVLDVFKCV